MLYRWTAVPQLLFPLQNKSEEKAYEDFRFIRLLYCFFVMFLLHNVAFFTMCLFLLQGSLQDCQNILFLQRCPGIFQTLVFGNVMCHFGKS